MLHRPQAAEMPATPPSADTLLQCSTPCDQTALQRLKTAFEEAKPAAILIGDGRARSSQAIDHFLATVDDKNSVARITTSCDDATSCMRAVVASIGFETKDFALDDLENIFMMFLCYQRAHRWRTVICIEDAQACGSWVLDKVRDLVDLEVKHKFGMFVIVSGQTEMRDLLYQYPLQDVVAHAGYHIPVAPLTLADTKEFVLQQIRPESPEDVSETIELEAITRLHEIGAGIPDTLSGLCIKSLQLANQESTYPITANTISRAACTLGLISDTSSEIVEEAVEEIVEEKGCAGNIAHNFARMIVSLDDNAATEFALKSDCVSVGRDSQNDLCIPSSLVSRHHVLILRSDEGTKLTDLGSTNGTFVNGERVNSRVLKTGDSIRLGNCEIEYVAAGNGT